MNQDYRLLDESSELLKKIRPWVSADFYRENVVPLLNKLRDRLAAIDAENFKLNSNVSIIKKSTPTDTNFSQMGTYEPNPYEPDTIPSQLLETTTTWGTSNQLRGEKCKKHPRAPHRYLKELSASMGRYVCQCEFWEP
jgi:hypothetical protein